MSLGITFCISSYLNSFRSYEPNIIFRKNSSETYKPCFYVLRLDGSLFVIIRGSAEEGDMMTMREMNELTTKYGVFHSGAYKSSLYIYRKIQKYLHGHNGNVYLIGHSYGGSCASILLAIIKAKHPFLKVQALGFGSYSVLDDRTSRHLRKNLITIANEDDTVPTISIRNLYEIVKEQITLSGSTEISEIAKVINATMDLYTTEDVPSGEFIQESFKSMSDLYAKEIKDMYDFKIRKSIRYPAGTVYKIRSNMSLKECKVNPKKVFTKVTTSENGLKDHTPVPYKDTIETLIED
ncbi:Lipase family protein [Histomonas meleagridis]|uniref:Lipase family protein n=1 Tax=Histomonas meleagridis TaxID=135588 RepID=UPI003559D215|nr:Lipase family protein [Histomonas meleagridis]KAH0806278.1 Lipase family protein [Histomonas meleagridis]